MNFSKIFIATITIFFASLSLTTANVSTTGLTELKIGEVVIEGGPRDVVQTKVDVTIIQPTASNLNITIVDANGVTVIVETTRTEETTISTIDLEDGDYIIETIDDDGDYQEFAIKID